MVSRCSSLSWDTTSTAGSRTGPGRKILTQWYCVFLVVFGVPVYYVLYHAALDRNIKLAILGTCMAGMLKLAWGIVPAYLCERFPTKRRAAGVGFGYSAGAILGAWFPLYVLWAHKIPFIHGSKARTPGCRLP